MRDWNDEIKKEWITKRTKNETMKISIRDKNERI